MDVILGVGDLNSPTEYRCVDVLLGGGGVKLSNRICRMIFFGGCELNSPTDVWMFFLGVGSGGVKLSYIGVYVFLGVGELNSPMKSLSIGLICQ